MTSRSVIIGKKGKIAWVGVTAKSWTIAGQGISNQISFFTRPSAPMT